MNSVKTEDLEKLIADYREGHLNERILSKAIANRADKAAKTVNDNLIDTTFVIGGLLLLLALKPAGQVIQTAGDAVQSMTSGSVAGTANHEQLARAFEAEAGKPYLPRAGEAPGPYCSFFVWSVFDKVGWKLPTTRDPIDRGMRSETPGRGLAASWGADMAIGGWAGVNRDPSKAKRGQIVLFSGTYGNFGPGAVTHVGFIVQDATPTSEAVIVDKGGSVIVQRRRLSVPGGKFLASFYPKLPNQN